MKIDKFVENWKNKEMENKLLKAVVLILAVGLVIEGALMIYFSSSFRTIVVPSYIDKKFYVEGDNASPEYIELMSKYAIDVLSNYTPETVEDRTREFLRFISPSHYEQISTQLLSVANESKAYSISQYFIPQSLVMKGNTINVIGFLRQFAQDKPIQHSRVEYKLTFKINNGRFQIITYEKTEKKS